MTDAGEPATGAVVSEQRCGFCREWATKLCDAVIGFTVRGPETCDAPLCRDHARVRATGFVCGVRCEPETIDHCPIHAGIAGAGGDTWAVTRDGRRRRRCFAADEDLSAARDEILREGATR